MKKTIALFSVLAVLSLTNCKKDKESAELQAPTIEKPANLPSVVNQSDLIKEAQSKPLTSIALSEKDFDFGKIKKGDHVEHTYEITNTGKNPLILSNVKPGCGCTVPDYTKEPILPGQKGKIVLKFDSSNFDGLVNKQAEIYANIDTVPVIITFRADIQK